MLGHDARFAKLRGDALRVLNARSKGDRALAGTQALVVPDRVTDDLACP
jgi:hypothetical protein